MYKCDCGREFKVEQYYNMHKPYCKGPKYCQNLECKKLLTHYQQKFCSATCSAKITTKGRKHTRETRKKISLSLGGDGKLKSNKTRKLKDNPPITIKKYCLNCGKSILPRKKYCSNRCQHDYKYKYQVKKWLNGEISGSVKGGCSSFVKRFLREKYGNKCSLCGWQEVNIITNNVPVEVDHIDGNHENNRPENLRLICPNCHSLTPTYKALNAGKGRNYRRKQSHAPVAQRRP